MIRLLNIANIANKCKKTVVYTHVNGDMHKSKTEKKS